VLGYDFIIECKKGCDNSAVDALSLSRRHESGDLLAISQPIPHWLELCYGSTMMGYDSKDEGWGLRLIKGDVYGQ
jgi:hypothetical protein